MMVSHSVVHSATNHLKHLMILNSILELTQEGNLSVALCVPSHSQQRSNGRYICEFTLERDHSNVQSVGRYS